MTAKTRTAAVIVGIAALVTAGCSEGQVTIYQLQEEGITTPAGVWDRLGCEGVIAASGWDVSSPNKSREAAALDFAQDNRQGVTMPETIIELRPGLWAVGDKDGVALGTATTDSVHFCGQLGP